MTVVTTATVTSMIGLTGSLEAAIPALVVTFVLAGLLQILMGSRALVTDPVHPLSGCVRIHERDRCDHCLAAGVSIIGFARTDHHARCGQGGAVGQRLRGRKLSSARDDDGVPMEHVPYEPGSRRQCRARTG